MAASRKAMGSVSKSSSTPPAASITTIAASASRAAFGELLQGPRGPPAPDDGPSELRNERSDLASSVAGQRRVGWDHYGVVTALKQSSKGRDRMLAAPVDELAFPESPATSLRSGLGITAAPCRMRSIRSASPSTSPEAAASSR